MKMVKKLALLLCLVMALSAFAVNAFAAEEANIVIEADKTVVQPGDTVNITVSLVDADKLEGGVWFVEFKIALPEGVTFVSGSSEVFDDEFDQPKFNEKTLKYGMMGRYGDGYTGGKLTLLTFQVTVADTANSDLVITTVADSLCLTDMDGESVYPSTNPECLLHMHTYTSNVVAPTCTEQGYTEYTCACGDSYKADYVDALGHDMGQWYIVDDANCTEDGLRQRDCSRCDHIETEVIPATGHVYTAVVTAPTCTEEGFTTYTCHCGDSYKADFVDALGHDWDDGTVTTQPTEESEGVKTYCCRRCDATYTETIPALDHVHDYVVVETVEPTCTEQGYTVYECRCGDSYKADFVDALGHDWDDGTVTTQPTEESEGVKTYCCRRCDATYTETIPALDHVHNYVAVETVEPTCTEQGYTVYECRCGDSYKADFVDALGHDMGEWTVVTNPSCTEEGLRQRACSRCDYIETETIPVIDHTHSDEWSSNATHHWHECTCGHKADMDKHTVVVVEDENGVKMEVCSICGYILGSAPTGDSAAMYIVAMLTSMLGLAMLLTKKKEF